MPVNNIDRISAIWYLPPRKCAEISSFGGNGTRKKPIRSIQISEAKDKN
jgi:hypothetical protein